jgi:hypothetical protein
MWLSKRRPDPVDHTESELALARAITEKERIDSQWGKVLTLSATLRTLREKNHFIEGFKKTL